MLNLLHTRVFHWRKLFAIMSLESSAPFLKEIGFPLMIQSDALKQISMTFLRDLGKCGAHIVFENWIPPDVEAVATHTYEQLVLVLGEEVTERLCQWGNLLYLEKQLVDSLYWIINSLLDKVFYDDSDQNPLMLSNEMQTWLLQTIHFYRDKRGYWRAAVWEAMEAVAESEWGREITFLANQYVHFENDELIVSSKSYAHIWLFSIIDFFLKRCLLKVIEQHFSSEEMSVLDMWLKTQSYWAKDQALEKERYYSLLEVLALLRQYDDTSLDNICTDFSPPEKV